MLLAPDRQARINGAVERAHANATATYQGGEPFGVILNREEADTYAPAVDVAQITVAYCVANTPGVREGSELVVHGVVHKVTGPVQPDAGGWVVLLVYPKA